MPWNPLSWEYPWWGWIVIYVSATMAYVGLALWEYATLRELWGWWGALPGIVILIFGVLATLDTVMVMADDASEAHPRWPILTALCFMGASAFMSAVVLVTPNVAPANLVALGKGLLAFSVAATLVGGYFKTRKHAIEKVKGKFQ